MTYEIAGKFWHFKQTLGGLDQSLWRYIKQLTIPLPPGARILDVGCGTGAIGLALLYKNPSASLVASDLNVDMLRTTKQRVGYIKNGSSRIKIGIADIRKPEQLQILDSHAVEVLPKQSFDIITAGAVLEHVDISSTLEELTKLLKPEGYLFVMIMKINILTKISRRLYTFNFLTLQEVIRCLRELGYTRCQVIKPSIFEFPLNLYRIGILARRG